MAEPYTTINCDVLVVGAGGTGLRAAVAAAEAGCRVQVVSKSLLGKAHTVMAEGGIAGADRGQPDRVADEAAEDGHHRRRQQPPGGVATEAGHQSRARRGMRNGPRARAHRRGLGRHAARHSPVRPFVSG